MSIKSMLNLSGMQSKWVCPCHACMMLCGETEASYQGHHCYLHLWLGHCHFGIEMVNWWLQHFTISQYTHFKLSLDSSHLCIVWLLVDTRTIITIYVLWLYVQKSSLSELTKFGYENKLWHRTVGHVVTRYCHNIKKYMRSLEEKIEANLSRTRPKRLICTKQWGCKTGRSGTVVQKWSIYGSRTMATLVVPRSGSHDTLVISSNFGWTTSLAILRLHWLWYYIQHA